MSPNQRAALEQFLEERHAELVDAVAPGTPPHRGRGAGPRGPGPYSAARARALGLIDTIADDLELPGALGLEADEQRAMSGTAGIGTFQDWERSRRLPRVHWMP